ncbi:MAG TPA: glycoside hydrolase family 43 protein [Candidatus Blautia ornithocaccae]|uniref:Glycoside hydrolase family 43 protein n=2 Tax=Blautia TaxID=572511 RepID=A0A9D2N6S4_9FIRM|nr:glycoside hydrolase family 43 protein [Candidatus Blautia merdigallinarum]HJD36006.1 glycoside hydrolase family 43 protein [Candidatus Blautia ornithocaccae]
MKKLKIFMLVGAAILCLAGCGGNDELSLEEIEEKKGSFSAGASVHDPSVFKENGTYYIFGSHMEAAKSENLREWKSFASGVSQNNELFDNLFDEPRKAFEFVGKNEEGGYSVWAPDVIYNEKMGKYMMYFCTTSTYKRSSICFATADNPEGPYTFQDTILHSGFRTADTKNKQQIFGDENFDMRKYMMSGDYNNLQWPNALDPSVFYDEDGRMWMVYGSWSGGIFILELDQETGYPIFPEEDEENEVDSYYGKHLIGGMHLSCEGPYILYDETSGYYYLFVSYGSLTADGGYQIRLYRSEKPDGPYVDYSGETFSLGVEDHSQYGLKMMGNYTFPSLPYSYMAPGHNSAFVDDDGKLYIVYHQRFSDMGEMHEPRVHQIFRNKDGWLVAAPFATQGEELREEGNSSKEIAGTYYYVNHGTDISAEVHEAEEIQLTAGGKIKDSSGKNIGEFVTEENSPYITLSTDEGEYEGVLVDMEDEAGNPVLCFTAAGENNQSVWGVKYLKE